MVCPSRDVRESITLSSWQPHLLQRILSVVVALDYVTIHCGVKGLFSFFVKSLIYSNMLRFWPVLICFALCACVSGAEPNQTKNETREPTPPNKMRTIAKGAFSGYQQPAHLIVTNETQWAEVWKKHSAQEKPAKPLPKVDFDKETVLFVALGQKTTGGYSVEISRVDEIVGKTAAFVKTLAPKPGGIQLQSLTAPFHIVAVPKVKGPLAFTSE